MQSKTILLKEKYCVELERGTYFFFCQAVGLTPSSEYECGYCPPNTVCCAIPYSQYDSKEKTLTMSTLYVHGLEPYDSNFERNIDYDIKDRAVRKVESLIYSLYFARLNVRDIQTLGIVYSANLEPDMSTFVHQLVYWIWHRIYSIGRVNPICPHIIFADAWTLLGKTLLGSIHRSNGKVLFICSYDKRNNRRIDLDRADLYMFTNIKTPLYTCVPVEHSPSAFGILCTYCIWNHYFYDTYREMLNKG